MTESWHRFHRMCFYATWSLRHPPMTSCPSIGLITHVIQTVVTLKVFPKYSTQLEFPICRSLRVMSWRHRGFTWKPRTSLTKEKTPMKLASGFCIPEPLPVHTGIKGRQVHPLIRFLLQSRVDEKSADLHKAVHLCFVPGWRNGAISGVPLISDSPGHFNWESKF